MEEHYLTLDEHNHNRDERVRGEIENKGVFAPVGFTTVIVTRSRNRPYVRISREGVRRRWRDHKWKIRGPLFQRASSLDVVREIPDPIRRYIRFDHRSRARPIE